MILRSLTALLLFPLILRLNAVETGKVDFNFHIRPILSDRCWACHGPDEKTRKAGLRLDTREGAQAATDGTHIIKPGDPASSELFKRLTSSDLDFQMPPPDSHLSVSRDEVALIQKWIEQGAEWGQHWAFAALKNVAPPELPDGATSPIDRFIRGRLDQAGVEPSPPANREKLIRRVTFDLTGLPPTIEEIDAFLRDESEDAFEKVIDRLLASTAFGERMAVDWLDTSRYSDTHGYQADRYRAMWPWRDWVIKAFNENMPYDQFVTWQLAGDLLPNPSRDQILATAFNRHHMQTEEGGSVEEEFRVAYVVDRVNTFGTAFLGMTFDCSRCHDHKYDPISQKEFYQLFSFFNNIDESGQTSHFTDSMPVPTLLLASTEEDRQLADLRSRIGAAEAQLAALKPHLRPAFDNWMKELPEALPVRGLAASFSFEEITDGTAPNSRDKNKPAQAVEGPSLISGGPAGRAAALNGENGFQLKGIGAFSRADPFTISCWIKPGELSDRAVIFHRSMAALDAASRGYEMLIEDGRVSLGLHHMWPGNSLKVISKSSLSTNDWSHLSMIYDGSSRAAGLRLYINGAQAEVEVVRDSLWKEITYERGDPHLTIGYRFRDKGFRNGAVDEFKVFDRELTALEIKEISGTSTVKVAGATAPDLLFDYYLATANPLYQKHLAELHTLRRQQTALINPIPEVMVMHELDKPRPAHVLARGAYDALGEPVSMATPVALGPFRDNLPRNRLGLARWMFDNPLAARVAANRLWQMMLGRGIVPTSDNFGSQGELPTHPELLDWLAADLRDSGWDIKRFLRNIAVSSTYQQSSTGTPEQIARDPENKLLSRAPSYRLPAEMIRDNALAASGLLVSRVGGPPVKPYQPEGLWEEKSGARYQRDTGDGLYRRSLYTFWKRTSPPPSMIAFDAAERNNCIVVRQVTSTPLQALLLLNDPQLVEASRFIAERMLKEGGPSLDDQLTFGFRLLTSRAPTSTELEVLVALFQEQKAIFGSDFEETMSLLLVGDKVNDSTISPVDLAAGTIVASALLNFDETIIKR